MSEYNGWTNWDTWNANLWLTNDETTYRLLVQCQSANDVKRLFKEQFTMIDEDGFLQTIDDIDVTKVDWNEIFEAIE